MATAHASPVGAKHSASRRQVLNSLRVIATSSATPAPHPIKKYRLLVLSSMNVDDALPVVTDYFLVDTASTIAEAVFHLNNTQFDAMLIDMEAETTGLHELSALHAMAPALPIVALSSVNSPASLTNLVNNGAYAVLSLQELASGILYKLIHCAVEQHAMAHKIDRNIDNRMRHLDERHDQIQTFAYFLSHDLRAPLRHIGGHASLLLDELEHQLQPNHLYKLRQIRAATSKAHDLIDGMLRLTRSEQTPLKLARINVSSMVRELLQELCSLNLNADSVNMMTLPDCKADAVLLYQVFANLISNALKFSSRVLQPHIEVGYRCTQDGDFYYVRDNGIGFDDQQATHLFQTFHRLPNASAFVGTGIGLSIAAQIIQRHNGKIWAHGSLGNGAEFCFSLPSIVRR